MGTFQDVNRQELRDFSLSQPTLYSSRITHCVLGYDGNYSSWLPWEVDLFLKVYGF